MVSETSYFQLLNSPRPGLNEDLAITALKDFRIDPEITEGKPDKTEFLFFDTPNIPNNFLYNPKMLNFFTCELKLNKKNVNQVCSKCVLSFQSRLLVSASALLG